jgi:hypothetical protein
MRGLCAVVNQIKEKWEELWNYSDTQFLPQTFHLIYLFSCAPKVVCRISKSKTKYNEIE